MTVHCREAGMPTGKYCLAVYPLIVNGARAV